MASSEHEKPKHLLSSMLLGRRLETKALSGEVVSKPVGLAVFASDALSSTAYSIEEILIILALAGTGAATLGLSIPITFAIVILLVILTDLLPPDDLCLSERRWGVYRGAR